MHSAIYCCMIDETRKWSLFRYNIGIKTKNDQTNLVNMKSRHCFMWKRNASTSLHYVLFTFLYGLSYLVMQSLRMIMCTFCLVEWLFYLIVSSLNLVMRTSDLVTISFFLVMGSYHMIQCFFIWLCFSDIMLCALYIICSFMRSCYALFVFALVMCSLYVLFVYFLWIHSFYVFFISALCRRYLDALFLFHLLLCIRIEELKVSQ